MRYFLGFRTTSMRTPRSVPFGPTFHLSSSSVANSSIDWSLSRVLMVTTAIWAWAWRSTWVQRFSRLDLVDGERTPAKSLTYPVGAGSVLTDSAVRMTDGAKIRRTTASQRERKVIDGQFYAGVVNKVPRGQGIAASAGCGASSLPNPLSLFPVYNVGAGAGLWPWAGIGIPLARAILSTITVWS